MSIELNLNWFLFFFSCFLSRSFGMYLTQFPQGFGVTSVIECRQVWRLYYLCLLCSLGSFMRVCFCYFYDIRLPEELQRAVTLRPLSINHIQLPSIVPGYQSLMTTPPDPCGPVGLTSRHKSNRVGLHTEPFWVAVTESHRLVDRKSHFFSRKSSGLFFMCCQCVLGQRARGSGSEPAILLNTAAHGQDCTTRQHKKLNQELIGLNPNQITVSDSSYNFLFSVNQSE